MKIIDTRDNTEFTGTYVTTLLAGMEVSDAQMQEFYRCSPGARHYAILKASQPVNRVVLRRGDVGEDHEPSYYIVPAYTFYRQVAE